MKIMEFDGDPMMQVESFDNLTDKIFFLNQESVEEILSYSTTDVKTIPSYIKKNVPLLNGVDQIVLIVEGGIDEEGKAFPETYIALAMYDQADISGQILSIYASDIQYAKPANGEEILLKKGRILKKQS